jgi:tRNA threonylcarbamoyladenosine modification (KEOPS) complex  Pcc1 subunit
MTDNEKMFGKEAKVTSTIDLDLGSEEMARLVASSIGPDNEGFVSTEIKGGTLILRMEAGSIQSMLHTVEDLLSCVAISLRALDKDGHRTGQDGSRLP